MFHLYPYCKVYREVKIINKPEHNFIPWAGHRTLKEEVFHMKERNGINTKLQVRAYANCIVKICT